VKLILATIASILTLTTLPAQAGPGISGGGKGVVCRSKSGKVRAVELLDLWEARVLHEKKIMLKGSVPAMVDQALQAFSGAIRSDGFDWMFNGKSYTDREAVLWGLRTQAAQFFGTPGMPKTSEVRRLRNVRLTLTDDSYEAAMPADCAVEQIVHYQDEGYLGGTILINQDLFDRMAPTHQAALIAHEAFYKFLRGRNDETSSLRVRRTVGLAFAGEMLRAPNKDQLPSHYYTCTSPGDDAETPSRADHSSLVYVVPLTMDDYKDWELFVPVAAQIAGMPLIDQAIPTKVVAPPMSLWYAAKDFADLSTMPDGIQGKNSILTVPLIDTVQPEFAPVIRIDEAAPNGRLKISIAARPSVFMPNGMPWEAATCEFHSGK